MVSVPGLRSGLMDQHGELHDVVILANDLEKPWIRMDDLNIDSDFCQLP